MPYDQNWGEGMTAMSALIDEFGDSSAPGKNAEGAHELPPAEQVEMERRLELQRRWSWYRCSQYDHRVTHWDGGRVLKHSDEMDVAASGQVPPGFWVSGRFSDGGEQDEIPLRMRKPSAPTHLGRSIINRFSGLLFGADRHPKVYTPMDPKTENWLEGFITETRLWSRMIEARKFGGAMGSFAVGFKFVNGRPSIEIFDPRMTVPVFANRETMELKHVDKRYLYEDVVTMASGEQVRAQFYYRRVITDKIDIVWPRVFIEHGLEPEWQDEEFEIYEHNFGFCPVVWVQNVPNTEDADGDTDLHGIYDILERIDALFSQADIGAVANCDPTFIVKTDGQMPGGLRKGSYNAITLPSGSDASYLELQGASIKVAIDTADRFKQEALSVARVVLDSGDASVPKTATEVMRRYGEMYEQVDLLREQYGESCVKKILEMVLQAVRILEARGQSVRLRPNRDGRPRELGLAEYVELQWPPHVEPGLEDAKLAVDTAVAAKNGMILDGPGAVRFVAPYLKIEDPDKTAQAAEEEFMQSEDSTVGGILGENETDADEYPEDEDADNFGDEPMTDEEPTIQ